MILAPTRELTLQLHKVVKELSRYTDLRTAVLVGGDSMEAQFAELAANPDVLLATPGEVLPLLLCLQPRCLAPKPILDPLEGTSILSQACDIRVSFAQAG